MRARRPVQLVAALAPLTMLLSSCVAPDRAPPVAAAPVAPPPAPAPTETAPTIMLSAPGAVQGGLIGGTVRPAGARLTLDGRDIAVADDGAFIIAFDRDAPASARLVARNGAGAAEQVVAVAPGDWRIEQVNARMTGGAASSEEFRARRAAEIAQMAAARATPVASDGWRQRFIWPVRGRISGLFGAQRVYRGVPGSYHGGTDIAAGAGTPFVAPADGVVILAATEPFTLEGHLLMVDHGMGLVSAFLHCSRLDVRAGQRVAQGQRLGLVGATGRASGPHMHWGLRWNEARIDPLLLAGPMG